MKKYIIKLLSKNKYISRIAKSLILFYNLCICRTISVFVKFDLRVIIFDSYLGKSFSCNPRYIYEEMRGDPYFKDYQFVWVTRKNNKFGLDDNVICVNYKSLKYYYYLSKAKYWVFNSKMPKSLKKNKGQIYLQTWHGTPLKKLARDIEIGSDATFYRSKITWEQMIKGYDDDVKRYDYLISPNHYSTKKFLSAFNIPENKIIETGYPRNDILTNYNLVDVSNIKTRLNIPKDKKVILYAPTWRDNSFSSNGYEFKPKVDFKKWKDELGDDYYVIYKPHYLIVNNINKNEVKDFIYHAKANDNINDLYLISDVLITDYSSVFFDFGILKRPILFYMYDLEEYEQELRGFYFSINNLPGPIIKDENNLINAIENIGTIEDEYVNKYSEFHSQFCYLEDGNASKRVINEVFKK